MAAGRPVPSRSDVRDGLRARRSLDAARASQSVLRSASNAGSTARASPPPCPTEARKDRVCPTPRDGVDGKRRHGCRSAAVFERAKSRMDAASVRREGVGRPEPVGRRGRPRTSAERRAKITRDPHQPPNHVRRARPSSSPMLRRASAKSALLAPRSRSVNVIGTSTIRPPARCTRQRKSSWNA